MDKELPAVVTVGGLELAHRYGRLWAELDSGAVVHVVTKHNGRHRGWIVPPPLPAGYGPERIFTSALFKNIGWILDEVRDEGKVIEIFDGVRNLVRGYLLFAPPDELAALGWDVSISYWTHTRAGLVQRTIYSLSVQAEPSPPRRGVLVS